MSSGTYRSTDLDIRPDVNILGIFPYLSYKPWHALAEFVDNSLQSSLDNKSRLESAAGGAYVLAVDIDVSSDIPQSITIVDNAAGIAASEVDRALKAAQLPPDRSGLSEFGVGLKSAAFWFAPKWRVRTSALGEAVEREINFDINAILSTGADHVPILETPCSGDSHFTEIRLDGLYRSIVGGRRIGKIRSHLASIFRRFIERNDVIIRYNGVPLRYVIPPILVAPSHKVPQSPPIEWRKDIEFDLGLGMKVTGFAALRRTGSTSEAGFALFRRNRLIEGSADETYRPEEVFGRSNSFTYQRLFGELNISGIGITHTKDGFQWDDNEGAFLELLVEHLTAQPLNLLDQAENYRSRVGPMLHGNAIASALDKTSQSLAALDVSTAVHQAPRLIEESQSDYAVTEGNCPSPQISRDMSYTVDGRTWRIRIVLGDHPSPRDLFTIAALEGDVASDLPIVDLIIKVEANHPFSKRWASPGDIVSPIVLEMIGAMSLGEIIARQSGVQFAGAVRRAVNLLVSSPVHVE